MEEKNMIKVYDKGNGKNFIGYRDGEVFELLKEGGKMYIAELKFNLGLCAMGSPLKLGKDYFYGQD